MTNAAERESLRNQYIISKEPISGHRRIFEIGEWFIGCGDGGGWTEILDGSGASIGAFFGAVIDFASSTFKPASIVLEWTRGSDQDSLESCLYERAGSWIAVVVTSEFQSVYLDTCGSAPLVYDSDRRLAGSSANELLLGEDYFGDLYEEAKSETWFKADWYHTAGLTAHRSLRRLLPNHRLNLESWSVERIWPKRPLPALPINQVVADLAQESRNAIGIAMQAGRALMPLTAGNETRALLSLVKDRKNDAIFFTGGFPGAIVDLGTAQRLAKRFGLAHAVTTVRARTKEDAQSWRRRTGHCVGGAIGFFRMERKNIAWGEIEFSGAAGEVGRGFLWSTEDSATDKLTSEVLLARLKLPLIGRFVVAVEEWLKSVQEFDAFTVMDLAYIELKMACWAGPQATGSDTDVTQIWPFSSRRCFVAMMTAPLQVRLEQSLFRRVVEREWPELLEIPINKGTMWENARKLIYRASSPRRVWGKIRKNFARLKSGKEVA